MSHARRSHSHVSDDDYLAALQTLLHHLGPRWSTHDQPSGDLVWRHFSPQSGYAMPAQGWKVHASCAAIEASCMYDALLPALAARNVAFKVPALLDGVVSLNSGDAGPTQLGKILTVYPRDTSEAEAIARELDALWPSSSGPEIPTDVTLRPGGAVGLRFGVIGSEAHVVRANGSEVSALVRPDGELEPDERIASHSAPSWIPPLSIPVVAPRIRRVSAAITGEGVSLVPVAVLQHTVRSTVILAMDAIRRRRVVVKIARRGVFGDAHGRDMSDALRREYEVLRRLPPDVGPAPYDLFEHDGESVLTMEDLGGRVFNSLEVGEQRRLLPELARLLARLHDAGIVHRDLKPLNVLATERGLRLVDFELSAVHGESNVIQAGTDGYAPPEGRTARATPGVDVHAFGALLAGSYLGCDVGGIPAGAGRIVGLMTRLGAPRHGALAGRLMATSAEARPTAQAAAAILGELEEPALPPCSVGERSNTRFALRSALAACRATESFETGGSPFWRQPHSTENRRGEALANGASGVLLGLASVNHVVPGPWLERYLIRGASWLASQDVQPGVDGLWVGNAGVALVLGILGSRFGLPHVVESARIRLFAAAEHADETDTYSGSGGICQAACLLANVLGAPWAHEIAERHARHVLSRMELRGDVPVWTPSPLSGESSPVLGAAHGSAGSAAALALWARACGRPAALDVSAEIFRSLFALCRTEDGRALRATLGGRGAGSGEWCHGAAGYLWALLISFGDDPRFREEIDWAVDAVTRAPVLSNPTYCHGIAGRLELWQMVAAVERHAALASRKANECVSLLRLLRQHGGVWGSESPKVIVPCLWVGFMGPATALARYGAGRRDALLSSSWISELGRPCRGIDESPRS